MGVRGEDDRRAAARAPTRNSRVVMVEGGTRSSNDPTKLPITVFLFPVSTSLSVQSS